MKASERGDFGKYKGSSPVIIAGSGRGGTTWVLELMCSDPRFRLVFEPLHELKLPESEPFSYGYYPESYMSDAADHFFHKVFSGQLDDSWTRSKPWIGEGQSILSYRFKLLQYYLADIKSRIISNRLVVKFIRGNLMIPWYLSRFDATVLLVTRSPFDICSSMVRTGWFENHLKFGFSRYLSQEELVRDHLAEHIEWMKEVDDPLECAAIMWVVENMVPLKMDYSPSVTVVPYEYLVKYSVSEFTRLFDSAGLNIKFDDKLITKPSSRSVDGNRFEDRPKDELEERGQKLIPEVMERFGFDLYNNDGTVNETSEYFLKWNVGRFSPR